MTERATITLRGIGASPGVAIGKAYILDRSKVHAPHSRIEHEKVDAERERLRSAIEESKRQLIEIRQKIDTGQHKEHVLILNTHLAILDDDMFTGAALEKIGKELINAEWAVNQVVEDTHKVFDEIEDPYLRERISDIDYIAQRILRNLTGKKCDRINKIEDEVIIVAHDLSPADTAQLNKSKVRGFVTAIGGPTSHTAIVARSLEIPAVVGVEYILADISDGDEVILDGAGGVVVIRPDSATIEQFIRLKEEYEESERQLQSYVNLPSETTDKRRVILSANLEMIDELPLLKKHGAEGIGLFRTEYIFLDRPSLPSEEEQFQSYKTVIENAYPFETTIRTLDLGGDKFNHALPVPSELNPAMGLRAIRLCLKEPDIFRTQLRAILRASAFGKVRIMFPMISGLQELKSALAILEEVKEDLRKKKIPFDENVKIGSMIEIPSASVLADKIAQKVDFLSIGTNDLIQYTLAIDRGNENVSYLYEPLHPAVLKIIRMITEGGKKAGKEVAMCGEMAGKPLYIPLLVGLGIDSLSMTAQSIPRVKKMVRAISAKEAEKIAEEVFNFDTASEIEYYLTEKIKEKWPNAFSKDMMGTASLTEVATKRRNSLQETM